MIRRVSQYLTAVLVGTLALLAVLWLVVRCHADPPAVEWSTEFGTPTPFTAAEIAAFERTPIGDIGGVTRPAGDGCNSCSWTFLRVSETEIQWINVTSCTLLACSRPGLQVPFK